MGMCIYITHIHNLGYTLYMAIYYVPSCCSGEYLLGYHSLKPKQAPLLAAIFKH